MTLSFRITQKTRQVVLAAWVVFAGAAAMAQTGSTPQATQPVDVVFVCQHGYAKSLVAAKHFERLAASQGLAVRALARGITAKDPVPQKLATALGQDGIEVAGFNPVALAAKDLEGAEYVLTFGVDLPFATTGATTRWDDVSALSENYPKARDEIVAHLTTLLERIKLEQPPR